MEWMRASQLYRASNHVAANVSGQAFPFGLGQHGIHEVIGKTYADAAAAVGFALQGARRADKGTILWIRHSDAARQHGKLYGHGLHALGLDPGRVLTVSPRRQVDALWTIEEGLRSRTVSLVMGDLADLDFTASRRLALASAAHGVPAILHLPHGHGGATAATARWRVQASGSTPNQLDPRAPGHIRWLAHLERTRTAPQHLGQLFHMEMEDETLSVHLVSQLGDGALCARPSSSASQAPGQVCVDRELSPTTSHHRQAG